MPETPNYYLSKGRRDDAIKSLKWLRPGAEHIDIKKELAEIQLDIDLLERQKGSYKDLFTKRANRKAIIIVSGILFFMQTSGIDVVLFNSQTIFQKTGSNLRPEIATIIIGAVQMLSSFITIFIVEKLGRKPLLIISGVGMSLTLVRFYIIISDELIFILIGDLFSDCTRTIFLP